MPPQPRHAAHCPLTACCTTTNRLLHNPALPQKITCVKNSGTTVAPKGAASGCLMKRAYVQYCKKVGTQMAAWLCLQFVGQAVPDGCWTHVVV